MRCRDRKRSPAPQRGVWGECGARQREGARAGATGYTASRLDLSVAIQVLDTSPYRAGQPHARHQLSSTLGILRRVAQRVSESFHEGGGNFHIVRGMPRH